MGIKNIFFNKKVLLFGRIIFWVYIIFLFTFNFFMNVLSYKRIQPIDNPMIFQIQKSNIAPSTLPILQLDEKSQPILDSGAPSKNDEENKWPSFESRFFSAKMMDFPQDESAHENLPVEWWYIAANLNDIQKVGKKFNLAFSLFKNSQNSFIKISDIEKGKTYVKKLPFLSEDLFNKNELDINFDGGHFFRKGPSEYAISFKQDEIEFDLTFESLKYPMVLDNNNGRFNYQQTKLKTSGEIALDNVRYSIEGYSWLEHQGMTGKSVGFYYGWRWLALQLDNDIELLWINAYPRKGISAKSSNVIIVYDNKNKNLLDNQSFSISNSSYWKSEHYGELYPLSTQLEIPSLSADLKIEIAPIDYGLKQMKGIFEGGGTVNGYYKGEKVSGLVQQEINPVD